MKLTNNRPLIVSLITIASIVTSVWIGYGTHKAQERKIISLVNITEATLNKDLIKSFKGGDQDLSIPGYEEMRQKMVEVGNAAESVRYIYVLKEENDKLIFLIDAQPTRFGPPHSADMAKPGQIYEDAPPAFMSIYKSGAAKIISPYTDKWGVFYTAAKTIRDDQTQEAIGLVGIDVTVTEWLISLLSAMTPPIIIGLLAILLYLSTNRIRQTEIDEQNQLYLHRNVVDSLDAPVFWLDKDGFIFYANKSAQTFLSKNTDEEDLMIWELSDNIPETAWPEFWQKIQNKPSEIILTLKTGTNKKFKCQYFSHNNIAYVVAKGCILNNQNS